MFNEEWMFDYTSTDFIELIPEIQKRTVNRTYDGDQ